MHFRNFEYPVLNCFVYHYNCLVSVQPSAQVVNTPYQTLCWIVSPLLLELLECVFSLQKLDGLIEKRQYHKTSVTVACNSIIYNDQRSGFHAFRIQNSVSIIDTFAQTVYSEESTR